MAVDTPARVAVLGAGPIGLEAAIYARFLGYDVDIYERGRVAENLLRWGHVRLFSPFGMNRSALGLAALSAQDADWRPPPDNALLTGREIAEQYYIPLAMSDLLVDNLHQRTEVVAIGREGLLKGEHIGEDDVRIDAPFRILLRDRSDEHLTERLATADVVIDATGTFGTHNWLGEAGIPAPGELAAFAAIEYGLPDVLGADREKYAHRHTLVIGSGYSAATTVVALEELARQAPYTSITWITRSPNPSAEGPIRLIPDDRLPERERLARAANRLAGDDCDHVTHWPETVVDALTHPGDGSFVVQLKGRHAGEVSVDRMIANVGYRPDRRIYSELQVHECYATDGPMKLSAALCNQQSADCLDQTTGGAQTLLNPEPDFYILGAKSYGRNSRFLIATGLNQIRDLFTIIGDREDLDLYTSIAKGLNARGDPAH